VIVISFALRDRLTKYLQYPSRYPSRFEVIYHVFLLIIMQEKPDSFTSKAKPLADEAEAGLTRISLFHRMKQSVSPLDTNSFMVWNKMFHAMKP